MPDTFEIGSVEVQSAGVLPASVQTLVGPLFASVLNWTAQPGVADVVIFRGATLPALYIQMKDANSVVVDLSGAQSVTLSVLNANGLPVIGGTQSGPLDVTQTVTLSGISYAPGQFGLYLLNSGDTATAGTFVLLVKATWASYVAEVALKMLVKVPGA